METDDIVRRWRANAAVAGVALTDEDVARIVASGALGRVARVEQIIESVNADSIVPDFLGTLSGDGGVARNG